MCAVYNLIYTGEINMKHVVIFDYTYITVRRINPFEISDQYQFLYMKQKVNFLLRSNQELDIYQQSKSALSSEIVIDLNLTESSIS